MNKCQRIRRARTCNRCRAVTGTGKDQYCDLGYGTRMHTVGWPHYKVMAPVEPCPKPLTVEQHCKAPRRN